MNLLPPSEFAQVRAYPRLPVNTPLQVKADNHSWVWNTIDISIGGLGAKCPFSPPSSTRLRLLFNLPNGSTVSTDGVVCYVHTDRIGVQFSDLPTESRKALEDYTNRVLSYMRSGGRVAKRLYVTLQRMNSEVNEQIAETVALSRNGGLLVCRAAYKVGDELRINWPERNRSAQIDIIFSRPCGSGDLIEIGFAIRDLDNFWQMEFPLT